MVRAGALAIRRFVLRSRADISWSFVSGLSSNMARQTQAFQQRGQPVISVDAKKEPVGEWPGAEMSEYVLQHIVTDLGTGPSRLAGAGAMGDIVWRGPTSRKSAACETPVPSAGTPFA
jgi:hypothetical protein